MRKFNFTNFIIILSFLCVLVLIYTFTLAVFDSKINDTFISYLTKFQKKHASDNVVLVVIDDKSLQKLAWPWNRNNYTKLFDYLENTAKAKVIVFKNLVIFPDTYNPKSDLEFFDSLKHNNNLINSYILMNSNISGDIIPADYSYLFDDKSNVTIKDERTEKTDFSYNGVIRLPKEFLENSKYFASSVLPLDKDESIRAYIPVVMYNNKFYPSIALSAYSMYTGINEFVVTDKFICSNDNCTALKIPIEFASIQDDGGNKTQALISFFDWFIPKNKYYSHKTYSAIDVLDSKEAIENNKQPDINIDVFRDKIVIVGLNAPETGWLQVHNTPISDTHADIDIQASMIDSMLSNSFKTVDDKDYTPLITIIFCFFILRGFKNFKLNLIFTTILSILYFAYYFAEYMLGIYTPAIAPVITMYSAAVFKALFTVITTDKTAEMIKHALGKYVSKDVMKKVISNLDKLKLGGTRTVVTVFFVDIRNFTKISEELPPNEVTSILNEYFSTIEPIIAKYHGIVNKYMGDGLLAVFGEPVKTDEHALNAVLCGIEIIEQVRLLREKFIKEGKPVINIGIGVNTGEVFAGNIGTEERFEYTVIGDNVNLASRIESYNQILKTQFLISEYTYEYVKDSVEVLKLSDVNIKGKSKPIDIYEVLRLKNDKH